MYGKVVEEEGKEETAKHKSKLVASSRIRKIEKKDAQKSEKAIAYE